ncbi:DinB family protein [Cellulomonas sp. URHB0016]
MTSAQITPAQFHESDGVEDWRVLSGAAQAQFRTGSFATGVAFVDAIGELADAADHHPDVDLRYSGVTVRLVSHDVGGLSDRDVRLARQISDAARELDIVSDPSAVPVVQGAVDAPDGRTDPPPAADEVETLLGFLDYHRSTLAWKTAGLDAAGLAATTAASTMTLGGLLKHLAYVEESWFSGTLHDRDPAPPWDAVDWQADIDWDWHSAADDSPDELRALWQSAVERSRSAVSEALGQGGLDQLARRRWKDGRAPSLRWIVCHMIEEYARHNGHADLLREAVDGSTGE